MKCRGPKTPPCSAPKVPKTALKQPQAIKPKGLEIGGSNFLTKPLKGKKTAWWRPPECMGPRTPPCAGPKGPQNSPKTALSHNT